MSDSLIPFNAHWLYRGGVAQTILGSQFPGSAILPQRKIHKIKVGPRSAILCLELENNNTRSPIVLLAHGMGGCSESGYMRRIAAKIWKRDFGVFMMNQRGSGPGLGLSETLWNGGSSEDIDLMVKYIVKQYPKRSLLIAGFSLSGNVLLKYLGEGRKVPKNIHGAFAVNPPIDLKIASQLLSRGNGTGLFNRHYMKLLRRQCQALAECYPDAFQPQGKFKTIWFIAGLHAGWVWVKHMGSFALMLGHAPQAAWWVGYRSDYTDGRLCVIVLSLMLVVALCWRRPRVSGPTS